MLASGPFRPDIWALESPARLEALRGKLDAPTLALSPSMLAALFEIHRMQVVAQRTDGLQDFPEFAVRVRGAFGRVLKMLGPPLSHRHDAFSRPRAWDVLFEPMELPGRAQELAKPLAIHAQVRGDLVYASVSLFGFAGFWLPDAAAALAGALEGGVSLSEQGRMRVPLTCIEAREERQAGFMPPLYSVREARLHFRTPLRLRRGDTLATTAASILIGLANRAARLAPWQGARLDVNWNEVHTRARLLSIDMSDLHPYHWARGTQRAGRRLPVLGLLGSLVLRGDLDFWTPFLQIAAAANFGAHASVGLGAFDLTLLP